jgi:hypothetical protein
VKRSFEAAFAFGVVLASAGVAAGAPAPAGAPAAAGSLPDASESRVVERVVARFFAPDTGGVKAPRFVYERLLAFEARLEALAERDRDASGRPYRARHVTEALERHVAETLLSSLHIDPEPTAAELARQIQSARARLTERVGGEAVLRAAREAEGVGARDLYGILRRQALASLYLDRMVAPMLEPTETELRALYARRDNPFRELPYVTARARLHRWYTTRRLSAAIQAYYQNARGRLTLVMIGELPAAERAPAATSAR